MIPSIRVNPEPPVPSTYTLELVENAQRSDKWHLVMKKDGVEMTLGKIFTIYDVGDRFEIRATGSVGTAIQARFLNSFHSRHGSINIPRPGHEHVRQNR